MSRFFSFAVAALVLGPGFRAAAPGAPPARDRQPSGVVVEAVEEGSPPGKAGIHVGDVLIGWERAANPPANPNSTRGSFSSPMDVEEVCIEESERGKLIMIGLRDGRRLSFEIPAGSWDVFGLSFQAPQLTLRPPLDSKALDRYREGRHLIQNKDLERGADAWRSLAREWSEPSMSARAVWLRFELGTSLVRSRKDGEGQAALEAALAGARELGMTAAVKQILCRLGLAFFRQHDSTRADEGFDEIIRISSAERRPSLWTAKALAEKGTMLWRSGKPIEASELLRRALEVCEQAAPGGPSHLANLNNLGGCATELGDLATAERLQRAALAMAAKVGDSGWTMLLNLGNILVYRGDFAGAEGMYKEALAVAKRTNPGTQDEGFTYDNLAELAVRRGDLAAAEEYNRRGLAIAESAYPGGRDYADSLNNLGQVIAARGDPAAAETLYRRALEIHEKHSPDSLEVTGDLEGLGHLALRRGDPDAARSWFERALAIRQQLAPGGVDTATSLNGLGDAAMSKGDLAKASELYERALALREKLAPDSLYTAETLHDLGLLHRRRGHQNEALQFLRRAVDALESQKTKLGGTEEIRSLFAASHADYYRDYIEVLIELGHREDAFRILERSRARALLTMLAERDLVFASDVPAELEKEKKLADAEYDRAQSEIRDLSPTDREAQAQSLQRLRDLRQKREDIAERIRKTSPRLASLQYPRPLDLAGAQAVLDPGTLLLAYCVGKEKSYLFAVTADSPRGPPLSVFALPIGEKGLRESVKALRRLIEWGEPLPELTSRAQSLYDTLLKPAQPLIGRSERLLILPDGPLHTLPWAALVRGGQSGRPQYLADWKPVSTAISATVYAEVKKERRPPAAPAIEVAAFGDPRYPRLPERRAAVKRGEAEATPESEPELEEEEVRDAQVRSVVRGGFRFDPLPATRQEVEQIARLYSPKAETYLGSDATEERAKSIGKDVPLIHYACHAIVNERFPLDSALVFSIPEKPREGQDNGLLQAWEIFERVRIDADLVTLSACESGLGKEMGGEGLIGMTRAFQYAGARSVLASLWRVEDKATGELMKRFYTYLKAGKTKDEALRSAQIDLIHSSEFSQPKDWAAFQLNGDWK